jgi:FkbM family methyltransferase
LGNIYTYNDSQLDHGIDNRDFYKNGEYDLLKAFLKRNHIIFDIGAYQGDWVSSALSIAVPQYIFAFEPVEKSFKSMFEKHFFRENVKTFFGTVGDYVGKSKLYRYNNDQFSGMSNMFGNPEFEKENKIEVEEIEPNHVSIDEFCMTFNKIAQINYVKAKVEGAELLVVKGSRKMLSSGMIEFFAFEYGETYLKSKATLKEICQIFAEYHYPIFRIIPEGLIHMTDWKDEFENYKYCNYLAMNDKVSTLKEMSFIKYDPQSISFDPSSNIPT